MSKLPKFTPLTPEELRSLWARHPDPEIRRLVLEVVRYRDVICETDKLFQTIHQTWRDINGGHLVAIQLLSVLLNNERERLRF
jgi:hypothetical protein